VTIGTFRRCLFINDYRLVGDHARLRVTLVAPHVRMASLQGEMGPRVVVEDRGDPALRIVTVRASSFSSFRKLAGMGILVTILTNLRRALELYLLRSHRHFMTISAFDGTVST